MRCNVVCTSQKVNTEQVWYFDSECSQHITEENNFLKQIQPCPTQHVTFRDGIKGKVLRGLHIPSMPKLEEVLLVETLKANPMSIKQLCDQDLFVKFTKEKCSVLSQAD